VAFYMASGQAREVATALIENGRPASTPAVFVENASAANERRVHATLQDLRSGPTPSFEGPALLLVGEAFQESSPQAATLEAQARREAAQRCRLLIA
jgi:siroheme synthase